MRELPSLLFLTFSLHQPRKLLVLVGVVGVGNNKFPSPITVANAIPVMPPPVHFPDAEISLKINYFQLMNCASPPLLPSFPSCTRSLAIDTPKPTKSLVPSYEIAMKKSSNQPTKLTGLFCLSFLEDCSSRIKV